MITAILSGQHIKRDGSIRHWNCVEYSGNHHTTETGEAIVRVIERGEIKQINLSTFTGTIISHDDEFIFENGQRVSKQVYYLPF
jgi:hypothetical protein